MIPHQQQRREHGSGTRLLSARSRYWPGWRSCRPWHAQATIAGTVKDTSGAILPGVTVEATSPALIEKVRSAVTDGAGLARIENLRPGVHGDLQPAWFCNGAPRGSGAERVPDRHGQRRA